MPIRTLIRRRLTIRRTLATAVVAILTAAFLSPAAAQATTRQSRTARESRPVYSYAHAIRESVWVDTGLDKDGDGKADRVAADIVRPAEPASQGRKVPVIMDASPYYSCCGRGNESQVKTYDAQGHVVQMPLFYDNYFVPRGYAFVGVDLAGTNRSDGCVDVGGRSDIQSAKAVIDWLNGRATAYTSRTGTQTVKATWTNGRTGMIGKSWDATIANGVAATGVKGLKTIVPISGISSWYDYYFAQGAPLNDGGPADLAGYVESDLAHAHCAAVQKTLTDGSPRSGDWTPLWTERNYVQDAAKVRASVFLVHGMQDLNVRTKHFGQWWDALAKHGVHRKIWLSQTGHVDPFDYRRGAWVDTLHRWFDHELLGYDNGIDREPMADIERHPDQWVTSRVWPPQTTSSTVLHPAPGTKAGVGTLGLRPATGTATFTDDPKLSETDWAAHLTTSSPEKSGFLTAPLTHDLRLSGSSTVTVTATPTTTSAHLSAVLVDVGPDTIRDYADSAEGITTLTNRTCWGESMAGDSACFKETKAKTAKVDYTVFSRGWADLGHYASLDKGVPLTPGKAYTMTLRLAATDHVVPKGHRLALIIAGTDKDLIDPPASKPTLTVDLSGTTAALPLVGGASAFTRATSGAVATAPAPGTLEGVRVPSAVRRIPM
ncbi:Xaa-Pro dipeptidyl-peptidase [Streptomyces roseochromogenus]|uniref:X-prolyl-dipeptidyl aminopeptidase n=1 Tax=Streptomyces roseochromogenus subsp. oscitans DS 12.976 TaxID=1352936 RepID=V6KTD2_STRRC|nr:Xaa-Pro dipeptidyl-peptidase [Streptomyces roseochromogenus]EST35273.1 x-prolyl-dipeptidyl aminopeptidase [Streptomyces roseochromogenus subsp. oscitans DS 12.976]